MEIETKQLGLAISVIFIATFFIGLTKINMFDQKMINVCDGYNDKMILMNSMPVYVPDERGNHIVEYTEKDGNLITTKSYRYDPKEAVRQVCND
jgi:hypothetical protein